MKAFPLVFFFLSGLSAHAELGMQLIKGAPVKSGEFKQVVSISTNRSRCTATVVGPRVLVTAAHCGTYGATSEFFYEGEKFSGTFEPSPLYAIDKHDLAVVVLDTPLKGAKPFSIGGASKLGMSLQMLGYGCTSKEMDRKTSGKLHSGMTEVTRISAFDYLLVSMTPTGALLCPGDSGGPSFVTVDGKQRVIGVHSSVGTMESDEKALVAGPNMDTRTDHEESTAFFKDIAAYHKVEICGVTTTCD